MNTKQSAMGRVWHTGGRCRRTRGQKGGFLPIAGLLGSVAAPLRVETAKPILRKIVGGRRIRRRHRRRYA